MSHQQQGANGPASGSGADVSRGSCAARAALWLLAPALLLTGALLLFGRGSRQGLEAEIERIRAAGEPVTVAEALPGPVPDDQNAALIYQRLFRIQMRGGNLQADSVLTATGYDGLIWDVASGTLPPECARTALNDHIVDWVYGALEKGARRPRCVFSFANDLDAPIPQMSQFRKAARWLAARARVSSSEGDVDDALRWARVGLQMSEHVADRGSAMDLLVAGPVQAIVMKPLHSAMNRDAPSVGACALTISCLRSIDREAELRRSVLVERAQAMDTYAQWRAAGVPLCSTAWYRAIPDPLPRVLLGEITARLYTTRMRGPFMDAEEARMLVGYRKALEIMDDHTLTPAEEASRLKGIVPHMPFSGLIGGMKVDLCAKMAARIGQYAASLDVLEVALALKAYKQLHGRYPGSLKELQATLDYKLPDDVFSDAPLIYRRVGDGFVVYSIGPDFDDDGGRESRDWQEGDVVWQCGR